METYESILQRKIDYYGETKAAYEFAAEEFANKKILDAEMELARLKGALHNSKWVPSFPEDTTKNSVMVPSLKNRNKPDYSEISLFIFAILLIILFECFFE